MGQYTNINPVTFGTISPQVMTMHQTCSTPTNVETGPVTSQDLMPLSKISEEYKARRQNGDFNYRNEKPLEDGGRRIENGLALWTEINGDKPVSAYSKDDIERFKKKLHLLPAHYRKSEKEREAGLTVDDYIKFADDYDKAVAEDIDNEVKSGELLESEAEIERLERKIKRLGRGTINKHISALAMVLTYFEDETGQVTFLRELNKIRYSKDAVRNDPQRFKRSLDDEHLYRLLTSTIFTGVESSKKYYKPGETIMRNEALYWGPLLIAFTGERREEAVQIKVTDVLKKEGIWCIRIDAGVGQSVKNESSKRFVPIPEILIKLGFLEFHKRQKSAGRKLMFPELKLGKNGCRGDIIGYKFLRMRQEIGLDQRGCDLHALRHAFCDEALKSGDYYKVMKLLGHAISGETGQTYAHKDPSMKELKKIVDKVTYGFEVIDTGRGPLLRPKKARIKDMDITLPKIIAH
ncbi:tyrosine-type recombinase/integrase [Terasakiella pusilla]|uniref:tyrosine-type recombinase/integrase n=1 Tax=Terasakiella pusilla TaxID=64973 RepID=UPI003AA8B8BE